MIDGSLFDKLVSHLLCFSVPETVSCNRDKKEFIARAIRHNDHPFGGIQVRDRNNSSEILL